MDQSTYIFLRQTSRRFLLSCPEDMSNSPAENTIGTILNWTSDRSFSFLNTKSTLNTIPLHFGIREVQEVLNSKQHRTQLIPYAWQWQYRWEFMLAEIITTMTSLHIFLLVLQLGNLCKGVQEDFLYLSYQFEDQREQHPLSWMTLEKWEIHGGVLDLSQASLIQTVKGLCLWEFSQWTNNKSARINTVKSVTSAMKEMHFIM